MINLLDTVSWFIKWVYPKYVISPVVLTWHFYSEVAVLAYFSAEREFVSC